MRACTGIILALVAGRNLAAQGASHVEAPPRWTNQAVSNSVLDARISAAATEYARYAPIPRVALYDMAYPADSSEYAALAGNALLVITGFAQDSSDLPLVAVYFRSSRGIDTLRQVAAVLSSVASGAVRSTFGPHRLDAVFLFPVAIRSSGGDLLADFRTRTGFRLGQITSALPPPVAALIRLPLAQAQPAQPAIWAMLRREYPDLAPALRPEAH